MASPQAGTSAFDGGRLRADIEGLRAIAVLGVLGFHAGVPLFGGGYVGVDVFYVISGFLITLMMLRASGEKPATSFGLFLADFYARRARRILPVATVVLLFTLVGASLVQNPLENARLADDARSTALFFSNIRFSGHTADYFATTATPSPFLQYWSLSLEEQFYLVWPLLFFGLAAMSARSRRSRWIVPAGLATLVVTSFVLGLAWMRIDPNSAFYWLPPRAWELGLGALIATYALQLSGLPSRARAVLVVTGLGAILAATVLFSASTPFPGWAAIVPAAGTALVIAAGCGQPGTGVAQRLLASRPMQLIGRYSFSLYLWHWPILVLKVEHLKWLYATWTTRTVFMLGLSFPVAVLTYHVVENPIRRMKGLRGDASRSLAGGVLLIAIALVGTGAFEKFGSTARLCTERAVTVTSARLAPTVIPTDFVPSNLVPELDDTGDRAYVHCGSPCVVGPADARRRLVLFGNSFAGHWGSGFEVAAERLGAKLEIHAPGGCASFLIPAELLLTTDPAACAARRLRVFASIDEQPPDIVVFSNMTMDVFESHPVEWEAGIRTALRRVPKVTTVLVLAETPRTTSSVPLCLAHNLEHAERCDQRWPVELNKRLEAIVREEGARFVDLRPLFCTATRCPAITEDMLIYADGDHLTVPYSRARGTWLTTMLRDVFDSLHGRGP